ncbi:MAG: glycoside hydrolase family 92 protein [Paraprevotella sp.]|nr:glycoside hydrolase family 92 protein [Paraprevotella sp.]
MEWENKQGGDDVDNIIADAFVKDVKGFDKQKAYELMCWNAFHSRDSLYRIHGWIPDTGGIMSCSYTMEYAYNDDCASRVVRLMGDFSTADSLEKRAKQWTALFNPDLESQGFRGFICPRKENGEWISIDPAYKYGSWVKYFYEGNSWVYTLFTPHQFDRLIDLCGGKDQMAKRLAYGFENKLIELDNEPGFLSPFIFNHCDRPGMAARYVNFIRKNRFSLTHGYPDNEDSGAMGAWYIFTSIGFFPNAGQDYYYLLPPAFSNITITMENGKKIKVETIKDSPNACYIQSVTLNGKVLDRSWIRHKEIAEGAHIVYRLTTQTAQWYIKPFEATMRRPQPFGVNLAGAEFFHKKMEGVGIFNKDYFYPTTQELDYWKSKGLDLIRLPFKWERIQHTLYGPLNQEEMDYIKFLLNEAHKRDMKILLDMHNYGRRKDNGKDRIIGDSQTIDHFASVWGKIAEELKGCKGLYGYGLNNEPHDMLDSVPWRMIAQAAIDTIRHHDKETPIVVGGNQWRSAERWPWVSDDLKDLSDPANNLIFEAHCYFDEDGSGIYRRSYDEEKATPYTGVDRVRPFVEWLKRNNQRGLIGEYGVPAEDPRWLECLDHFLDYLSKEKVNGTYWAAGARWNDYILSVHPDSLMQKDKPQMQVLTRYLTSQ